MAARRGAIGDDEQLDDDEKEEALELLFGRIEEMARAARLSGLDGRAALEVLQELVLELRAPRSEVSYAEMIHARRVYQAFIEECRRHRNHLIDVARRAFGERWRLLRQEAKKGRETPPEATLHILEGEFGREWARYFATLLVTPSGPLNLVAVPEDGVGGRPDLPPPDRRGGRRGRV